MQYYSFRWFVYPQEYLASLPSRQEELRLVVKDKVYLQAGNPYPSPYDYSIYIDYLKALFTVIPDKDEEGNEENNAED